MFLAIYEGSIDIWTGLLVSLIAIALVFSVLIVIICSVNVLRLVNKKDKKEAKAEVKATANAPTPAVKNTEIKDEDMMVAALVATIDYANETKKDVKLVSIKQIG